MERQRPENQEMRTKYREWFRPLVDYQRLQFNESTKGRTRTVLVDSEGSKRPPVRIKITTAKDRSDCVNGPTFLVLAPEGLMLMNSQDLKKSRWEMGIDLIEISMECDNSAQWSYAPLATDMRLPGGSILRMALKQDDTDKNYHTDSINHIMVFEQEEFLSTLEFRVVPL